MGVKFVLLVHSLGLVKDKETVVWWVHGVGGGGKV